MSWKPKLSLFFSSKIRTWIFQGSVFSETSEQQANTWPSKSWQGAAALPALGIAVRRKAALRSSPHPSNEQRKIPYMATEFVLIICLEQPLSDMKGRGDHPLSALLQGAVLSLPPREVKWAAGDTGHEAGGPTSVGHVGRCPALIAPAMGQHQWRALPPPLCRASPCTQPHSLQK